MLILFSHAILWYVGCSIVSSEVARTATNFASWLIITTTSTRKATRLTTLGETVVLTRGAGHAGLCQLPRHDTVEVACV